MIVGHYSMSVPDIPFKSRYRTSFKNYWTEIFTSQLQTKVPVLRTKPQFIIKSVPLYIAESIVYSFIQQIP